MHVIKYKRPMRWLLVLLLMAGTTIFITYGYTSIINGERESDLNQPSINIKETIQAIEIIERNVQLHTQGTRTFLNKGTPDHDLLTQVIYHERVKVERRLNAFRLSSQKAIKTTPMMGRGKSTTTPRPLAVVALPNIPKPFNSSITKRVIANNKEDKVVMSSGDKFDMIPRTHVTAVNCAKLFQNDQDELKRAHLYARNNVKVPIPDEEYSKLTANCDKFRKERQYIMQPLSIEEEEFPLAYSMLLFKDVEQVERLLRAIYRPQNYYCIHVDVKVSKTIRDSIVGLTKCFDNVFMASRSVNVEWGWFSVLEPELICMQDLLKYKKWKYFINLTGQEWPLKTNEDLVKILKVLNGSNSMEGTVKRRNVQRTQYKHSGYYATDELKKEPPPQGIVLTKGSVHITVSRAFVEFVINDPVALEWREWVMDTGVPDETFFASLQHSPSLNVPGAYKGVPETDPVKYPFIGRFKNWGTYPFDYPCKGQRVRMVCVWSVGDLAMLKNRPELFTNKFYLDYQPLALDCMEELHYNRTREEVAGTRLFSTNYYKNLDMVKNHV